MKSSGHAPVNGIEMYYETHGEGSAIVLLHGSYMTIDSNFGELIPRLAEKHLVVAVEMQGHGRTPFSERPYSYDALASDVAELLKFLEIERAAILGYSLGGIVALQAAIKYPDLFDKLVFVSSVYKFAGWVKPAREMFPTLTPEFFEKTPIKTEYDRVAANPADWERFVRRLAEFDAAPFDLGKENVGGLKCPALLIFGDNDGVELSHKTEIYELLGGGVFADMGELPKSQLAILPAMTHVNLMKETDRLANIIEPFLDRKS